MRATLRQLFHFADRRALSLARHRWFRPAASLFVLREMTREASAVMEGRRLLASGHPRAQVTSLRRSIHRVEKGLSMRPLRVPFGADLIPEVVNTYVRLSSTDALVDADLAWCEGVLSAYFARMGDLPDEWLTMSRDRFRTASSPSADVPGGPAERGSKVYSPVTITGLEELARRRRSVRWFEPGDVEPRLVDRAILVGAQAPSACNRQSIRFDLTYGSEAAQRILETVGGTRGFSHQVPCVAVVIGSHAGYGHTFDRHAIFIDGGLAVMGFLFGLEAVGLASCCINWPDVRRRYRSIGKLIPLSADEEIIMLIAIGHPDESGMVPSSHKRGIDVLRCSRGAAAAGE